MKTLTEMTNRELFAVLCGDNVIQQAYLQKILRRYLKYTEREHIEDPADLSTIVKEYAAGTYGQFDD